MANKLKSIIVFLGIIILGSLVLSQLQMTEGFSINASPDDQIKRTGTPDGTEAKKEAAHQTEQKQKKKQTQQPQQKQKE